VPRQIVLLAVLALGLVAPPAGASAAPSGPPPGWKQVRYGAVSFAVPAAWPVYDLQAQPRRCARLDAHAVYLGHQGELAACPARALGKTEAVRVEPLDDLVRRPVAALATRPATVAGQPARVDPAADTSTDLVVAFDRADVVVTASYGTDPALARRILATLRVDATGRVPVPRGPVATATATPRAAATAVPGVYTGKGFDTCAAPSLGAMSAWRASPYRAIGIYIGGSMRACGDGNPSASWIRTVAGAGWHLAPIYVGLQAPCVFQPRLAHIDPATAATQGAQAAADAATRAARVFGLGAGTPITFDMEAYDRRQSTCVRAVLQFLSAWTGELHRRGYRSGVYSSAASGVTDLVLAYNNPSVRRPDFIWFAHWNGHAGTQDPYLPSWAWPGHRRIAQYRGGHDERWGNVTINIDNDYVDSILVGPRAATPAG
jgi:hypothetical protein